MPKKNKKASKSTLLTLANKVISNQDDDMVSVASDLTDSTVNNSDEENEVEDTMLKFESKIEEAMDLATEKSAKTRENALTSIKTALEKRVVTLFLLEHYQTITDLVEKAIKKGRPSEQIAGAKLLSVFILSLFGTEESEKVYTSLESLLTSVVSDPTANPQVRTATAKSFAITAFVGCEDPANLNRVLNTLHEVFCAALPKGNGELPTNSTAVTAIHIAALEGVCLLLTLLCDTTIYSMAPKMLEEFSPLLKSSDLNMRIKVGEAIALIYESAREHSEDFRWKKQSALMQTLEEFVNESHKYQAKKDRATQRTSFRDIYQFVRYREFDSYYFSVGPMFGPDKERQRVFVESWCTKAKYEGFRSALDKGLDMHMTYNEHLREMYDLGPPLCLTDAKYSNIRKTKRINRQSPETKRRFLTRNKNRDNRAAAREYND